MKTHDFHAIERANRLALRYCLLSLVCVLVTVLEIKILNIGPFWQLVGFVGSLAFIMAAHRAYSAPRREEGRRIREAIRDEHSSFIDPL